MPKHILNENMYYSPLPNSRIRKDKNGSSSSVHPIVSLSGYLLVCPSWHIPPWQVDGWMFVCYIWYHDQVQGAAHICEIEFSSSPNVSNYGHLFVHFVFCSNYLREECVDLVHIWYSNQVPCVTDALGSVANLSDYGHVFIIVVYMLWQLCQ